MLDGGRFWDLFGVVVGVFERWKGWWSEWFWFLFLLLSRGFVFWFGRRRESVGWSRWVGGSFRSGGGFALFLGLLL